ncbi:MAG: O-antigen ligase family protein [bacterium]|nr:O-antigen ligase family protein [bacterium]
MERLRQALFFLLLLLLPTQFGRHFWPDWAKVLGLRVDYLSPTVYLTDVLLIVLFIFFLPQFGKSLRTVFQKTPWRMFIVGVALILVSVGIIRSERPFSGLYQLAKWGELSLFAFYISRAVMNRSQIRQTVFFLSGGLVLEASLSLAQFFNQGSIGGAFWWLGERTFSGQTPGIAQASLNGELFLRPYGTFPHPNVLAGYLVIVLVLALWTSRTDLRETISKGLTVTLGVLALFSTLSRAAWVVGFFLIAYRLVTQKKWLPFFLMIFLIIVGSNLILARFQTLADSGNESREKRQELNQAAVEMIKTHPFLGVGLGNFLPQLPGFHKDKGTVRFLQPAHNVYLMVGAETGLIGLGLFLGLLFLTIQHLWNRYRLTTRPQNRRVKQFYFSILLSFSAILFLAFFDHYFYTLQQGQLLLALITGFAWTNIYIHEP